MCGVVDGHPRQLRSRQEKPRSGIIKIAQQLTATYILGEPLMNKQSLHLLGRALCILRLVVQLC